uniref:Transient receptor ion channel domain-containing protein n=1 Tax=Plectus sambesii TaxID=2011161 RepID=A0A914W776_9BILA
MTKGPVGRVSGCIRVSRPKMSNKPSRADIDQDSRRDASARHEEDAHATPESDALQARFWKAVENSDEEAILSFLRDYFHMAPHDSTKICDLLLKAEAESAREALLIAIAAGRRSLVETLLVGFDSYKWEGSIACTRSLLFEPHMTPLMLACLCNNYGIVESLLKRGHSIMVPHRIDCLCGQCRLHRRRSNEAVISGACRIDAYRAITSHAYLWLASGDPVNTSFELARELQKCSQTEPAYKEVYEQMSANVETFSEVFVQQCWTQQEMELLLDRNTGVHLSVARRPSPRLRLALDAHMKKFLASMNVQSVLESRWLGTWGDWGVHPIYDWVVRMTQHTIFYPISAFLFAITAGFICTSYKNPYSRFVSYFSSYLTFLLALLVVTQVNERDDAVARGFTQWPSKLACLIYVWLYVFGMVFWDFCAFCRLGFRRYFDVWWHWFDFLLWGLFLFAFITWTRASQTAQADGLHKLHRRHWVWYDARLVHEAFFAAACVAAFWRLFYFMQVFQAIGPVVISIGRCVGSVIHYLIIMLVVMTSFAIGINSIFEPYNGNRYYGDDGSIRNQPNHFKSFTSTLWSLYWAFFGYMPPTDLDIVAGQAGPDQTFTDHYFTQLFGEIVVCVYHVIIIITLLNLMISLMVRIADQVLENESVEWKYVRCHIWADFLEATNSVPPPFNIIYFITTTLLSLFDVTGKFSWPELLHVEPKADEKAAKNYQQLIVRLYLRFKAGKYRGYKSAVEAEATAHDGAFT